jgi:lipoprotein NlpD
LRLPRSIQVLSFCCLLLGGCADTTVEGPELYVVRAEDTLYSIAWRHDLDYRDLTRWNNLGADFRIAVGQVLVLGPGGAARPIGRSRTAGVPRPISPAQRTPAATAESVAGKWVWPTERLGEPRAVQGGGILVPGRLGQDVRAAGAGRVVYTGSGLRGYGNLIIIKHAESLLSAYAHNRDMLVRDGQDVAMGQVIGHMGDDAHQLPVLYFEIRQNGKPVDPLPILPRLK